MMKAHERFDVRHHFIKFQKEAMSLLLAKETFKEVWTMARNLKW
jgi:hypothetical protein